MLNLCINIDRGTSLVKMVKVKIYLIVLILWMISNEEGTPGLGGCSYTDVDFILKVNESRIIFEPIYLFWQHNIVVVRFQL